MSITGYKVFNPDWTCRGKAYTCPGTFEEDVNPTVCEVGMHFCKKAADCFNYYSFDSRNHVAEVRAYGTIIENDVKCCTNKLEIVREIPWSELLEMANTGSNNTGLRNSGNWNSGNWNSGNRNSGNWNSGNRNSGDWNSGDCNSGDCNSGDCNSGICNSGNRNSGDWNSDDCNSGDYNSGTQNSGDCNSGNRNSGDCNSGDCNSGNCNSGNRNSGDWNSGDCNSGDWNSGDWNSCNHSSGCFNVKSNKIYFFNKPSNWTYQDWSLSVAKRTMDCVPSNLVWVEFAQMTDEEKESYPAAKATGGYLRKIPDYELAVIRNKWWARLSPGEKDEILKLPNFDKEIFKEITMIDVSNAAE